MLRIKPIGSKLWLFNYYRPFTKKRANISFGTYPEETLAEAREKRAEARKLLANDIDPKEDRDTKERAQKSLLSDTFEIIAVNWYELKAKKVMPETGQRIWNFIENHLLHDLGKYPISRVTTPQVIEVLKPIASKDSLELVRRLCQRINEIMNHAVNAEIGRASCRERV